MRALARRTTRWPAGGWWRGLVRACAIAAAILGSAPPASAQSEQVEYYALDALGSVRVVFDANGTILGRMDYAPFGEELSGATGLPDRRFAGLFRDGEAGLDAAGARSYQVRTGRFSTSDPVYAGIFEPQRWNRYSYALNSPLVFVDPTGLTDCTPPRPLCFATGFTGTLPKPGGTPGGSATPGRGGAGADSAGSGDELLGVVDDGYVDTAGSSGGQQSGDVPLTPKDDAAMQVALNALTNNVPSQDCQSRVINKVSGLSWSSLRSYLLRGAQFFDGTRSTVSSASLYPPTAGNVFLRLNPSRATVAQWFSASPGVNAVTSMVAPRLTVYLRPSTIDPSNAGANARNISLLFHESLHGYGGGQFAFQDEGLEAAFGLQPPSANISSYIRSNCK